MVLPVVADADTLFQFAIVAPAMRSTNAFLLELFQQEPSGVASAFAALRVTLRSAPEPDRLLERLAADGQASTAAAMHEAWQQGNVRL